MKQRVIKRPDMPLARLGAPAPGTAPSTDTSETPVASATTQAQASPPLRHLAGAEEVIDVPVNKLRVSPCNARKIRLPKRVSKTG